MNIDRFPEPEGRYSKVIYGSMRYRQVGFVIGLPEATTHGDDRKRLIDLLTQSLPPLNLDWIKPGFGPLSTDYIQTKRGFMTEILLSHVWIHHDKLIDPRKAFDLLRKEYGDKIHLTIRMPREDEDDDF